MENTIALTVNGKKVQAPADPNKTLLEFLRKDLRLTGTKNGCGQGECGVCSVLLNGKSVNSCMIYLPGLEGADVVTIEGLSDGDKLDVVQQAFVDHGAIQCGFCTPGTIISAKGLLMENPSPNDTEIRAALSGNLCRCTGYKKIFEAVRAAAGRATPEHPNFTGNYAVIGRRTPRRDIRDKALGRTQYADDLYFPDMLTAKALRSEHPHALIKKLDISAAMAAPGVVTVLTAADIPGLGYHGTGLKDNPIIAIDKVRSYGDAVAVVVAEDERTAEEALRLIEVEYEVLPTIGTIEEALAKNAPKIHESGNLLQEFFIKKGDVEEAFAQCAVTAEETFKTQMIEHAYMETECSVAYYDPKSDILTVCSPTQEVYSDRRQVAASLSLPQNKVRIIQTATGGAFGGKIDISTEIIAALAAYKTRRTVKFRYSREESMISSTKRHPFSITMKMGADAEGKILAMQSTVYVDNGAYASMGPRIAIKSAVLSTGPYEIPNIDLSSYVVYTNNPFGGAMRGYGQPQAAFAYESIIEMLAEKLGIDPWQMRYQNAVTPGSVIANGQVLKTANLQEVLVKTRDYLEKHPLDQ